MLQFAEGRQGCWGGGCSSGWLPCTMSHLAENLAIVQKHFKWISWVWRHPCNVSFPFLSRTHIHELPRPTSHSHRHYFWLLLGLEAGSPEMALPMLSVLQGLLFQNIGKDNCLLPSKAWACLWAWSMTMQYLNQLLPWLQKINTSLKKIRCIHSLISFSLLWSLVCTARFFFPFKWRLFQMQQ